MSTAGWCFLKNFQEGEYGPCYKLLKGLGFEFALKSEGAPTHGAAFIPGAQYSREDVQHALGLKPEKGGDWATGHHRHGNDTFIFPTMKGGGSTGHVYDNRWVGDLLYWQTKNTVGKDSPSVQAMINPPDGGRVFIFTREGTREKFTFEGYGRAVEVKGNRPVSIVWEITTGDGQAAALDPTEVVHPERYLEGATRTVAVNVYERNPRARRACIARYGAVCAVCSFDFGGRYKDIGAGFIHVHHLKQLSEIDGSYEVDPINDLRPVCPNCHAMLHQRTPPYTIAELQGMLV